MEVLAEPVRKSRIQVSVSLAKHPPSQGRAPASRIIGNNQGETLVLGCRPQSGLAQPRMSEDRYPRGVHAGNIFKIIERPAQPPGPRANRAPFAGSGVGLTLGVEKRLNAVLETVVKIWVKVAVIDGSKTVAPLYNKFGL